MFSVNPPLSEVKTTIVLSTPFDREGIALETLEPLAERAHLRAVLYLALVFVDAYALKPAWQRESERLHLLRYGSVLLAHCTYGLLGVKVWIHLGKFEKPEKKEKEAADGHDA